MTLLSMDLLKRPPEKRVIKSDQVSTSSCVIDIHYFLLTAVQNFNFCSINRIPISFARRPPQGRAKNKVHQQNHFINSQKLWGKLLGKRFPMDILLFCKSFLYFKSLHLFYMIFLLCITYNIEYKPLEESRSS